MESDKGCLCICCSRMEKNVEKYLGNIKSVSNFGVSSCWNNQMTKDSSLGLG